MGSNELTDHNLNKFAHYFKQKVLTVRNQTGLSDSMTFDYSCSILSKEFSSFVACSESEVKKIIMNSPTKSCGLDCLPTHIFKKYVDLFLPYLTGLINLCLATGHFPSLFKHAIITPLLKKVTGDRKEIYNYRPVSNLSFISKVLERIVAKQLLNHLETNCPLPVNQSGYRRYHSTETALLQVTMELFTAINNQEVSLLALLDMSAAFDCVDHAILLEKMAHNFGISDNVASWFKSYLTGRSSQVLYNNELSAVDTVLFGVPQGSVLGPILFLMYTADVFALVHSRGFKIHAFADDIQIITSSPADLYDVTVKICFDLLSVIDNWMSASRLKLNQCKTQLLTVGTWQQRSKLNLFKIK